MTAKEVFEQYKDGLISLGELLVWCADNANLLTPTDTQAVLLATVGTLRRDVPIIKAVLQENFSRAGRAVSEAVLNLQVDSE